MIDMESYLLYIKGKGIDDCANKHCKDDDAALGLAKKIVRRAPLGTTIKVYHLDEADGRTKTYVGMVKH